MKFLVDAQLPRALSHWLGEQGYDSRHTLDLPDANRTTDTRLCEVADTEDRILITKDSDFVDSHEVQSTPAKLLLISTGNISNADLFALWKKHLPKIANALEDVTYVELTPTRLISHE